MFSARQGDVILVEVDAIPAKAQEVPRDRGRIVLAYGEATGHAHAITAEKATLLRTDTGERFLRIMEASGVELVHEEHATVAIPARLFRVITQREYVASDIERKVVD